MTNLIDTKAEHLLSLLTEVNNDSQQTNADVSDAGGGGPMAVSRQSAVKVDTALLQPAPAVYQWEEIPSHLAPAPPSVDRDTLTTNYDGDNNEDSNDDMNEYERSPPNDETTSDIHNTTGETDSRNMFIWMQNFQVSVSGASIRPQTLSHSAVSAASEAVAKDTAISAESLREGAATAALIDKEERVISRCVRPLHWSGGVCSMSYSSGVGQHTPSDTRLLISESGCELPSSTETKQYFISRGRITRSVDEEANSPPNTIQQAPSRMNDVRRCSVKRRLLTRQQRACRLLRFCSWYHGAMSWQQACSRLRSTEAGTFLARDSRDSRAPFALSVQTFRGPTSIRVHIHAGDMLALDAPAPLAMVMPRFDSLPALVNHYMNFSHMVLTIPGQPLMALRFTRPLMRRPNSLRHAARLALNRALYDGALTTDLLNNLSRDDCEFFEEYPYFC